jgi:hypothetical protein
MRLTHSPTRVYRVVASFKDSQPHVDAIESIGFGGLLQMPIVALRKQMILDIVQAYDTKEHGLMMSVRNVVPTLTSNKH